MFKNTIGIYLIRAGYTLDDTIVGNIDKSMAYLSTCLLEIVV